MILSLDAERGREAGTWPKRSKATLALIISLFQPYILLPVRELPCDTMGPFLSCTGWALVCACLCDPHMCVATCYRAARLVSKVVSHFRRS